MSPELERIQAAVQRAEELDRQYRLDREAARDELKQATRALADIASHGERVQTVIWAAENTAAPKNDLAWVAFGKEHQEFHLRKLVKGAQRNCGKCGKQVYAGNRFELKEFYCDPCDAVVRIEQQRMYEESERRREAKAATRAKRIAELKAKLGLSDVDAKELAALMVAQVDGRVSQISDFIFEGEHRD